MKPLDAARIAELRALHDIASSTTEDAKSFAAHAYCNFLELLDCAERVDELEREIHTARNLAQEAMAKGVMKDKRIKVLEETVKLAACWFSPITPKDIQDKVCAALSRTGEV